MSDKEKQRKYIEEDFRYCKTDIILVYNDFILETKTGTIQGYKKSQTPYIQSYKGYLMVAPPELQVEKKMFPHIYPH
jgi:hypothetical protein